jgi:uncharacterized DUF497 family protein
MIDFARIVGFDWDEGNSRKSLDRHGVEQSEAEQVFLDDRLMIAHDIGHSQEEVRYQALGETATHRRLHITFTLRSDGMLIRIISARDMNRKERPRYENQA